MDTPAPAWAPPCMLSVLFTPSECADIIVQAEALGFSPAIRLLPGGGSVIDREFRDSQTCVPEIGSPLYALIETKVAEKLDRIKAHYPYDYHAEGRPEILINRYVGNELAPGHLSWHADLFDSPGAIERKLSLCALLNPPSQFEGGDLLIRAADLVKPFDGVTEGMAAIFPSYIFHRVTPVTRGIRYTLALWYSGPRFR